MLNINKSINYKAYIILNVHVSSLPVTYMDDASRRLLVIQAISRILQYTEST